MYESPCRSYVSVLASTLVLNIVHEDPSIRVKKNQMVMCPQVTIPPSMRPTLVGFRGNPALSSLTPARTYVSRETESHKIFRKHFLRLDSNIAKGTKKLPKFQHQQRGRTPFRVKRWKKKHTVTARFFFKISFHFLDPTMSLKCRCLKLSHERK